MDAVRGLTNAPAVRLLAAVPLFAASFACQSTRPASNVSSPGSAEPAAAAATLQDAAPVSVGFDAERLQQAAALLEKAVAEGVTPGGVLLVARRGAIALEGAAGRLTWDDDAPAVTPSTIYDLASLTKVIATTTLMMRRVGAGALDLDTAAASYLPELEGRPVGDATLRDLLAHSSGLPCCTELFRELGENLDRDDARVRYLEHIAATELEAGARERAIYSDLGVLLVGEILERQSGRPLDDLVQEEILDPLGLRDTGYLPDPALRHRNRTDGARRLARAAPPRRSSRREHPCPGRRGAPRRPLRHGARRRNVRPGDTERRRLRRAPAGQRRNGRPLHPSRRTRGRQQPGARLGHGRRTPVPPAATSRRAPTATPASPAPRSGSTRNWN